MVYQDRIKTNCTYSNPENSERCSMISGIIFEVNIVAQQKQAYW